VFRAVWLDCSTRLCVCSADAHSDECRRHLRADAIADVIADVSGRYGPRAFDALPPNRRHAGTVDTRACWALWCC
jgi:hypothetical protein